MISADAAVPSSRGRAGEQVGPRDTMSADRSGSGAIAVFDELGEWLIVRLAESLDAVSASWLRQLFADLPSRGNPKVLVDLTAVPFIDSAGLGVLIGACRRLRAIEGDLRLAEPRPNVAGVLRLTGISRVIPVYPTLADARADLS